MHTKKDPIAEKAWALNAGKAMPYFGIEPPAMREMVADCYKSSEIQEFRDSLSSQPNPNSLSSNSSKCRWGRNLDQMVNVFLGCPRPYSDCLGS